MAPTKTASKTRPKAAQRQCRAKAFGKVGRIDHGVEQRRLGAQRRRPVDKHQRRRPGQPRHRNLPVQASGASLWHQVQHDQMTHCCSWRRSVGGWSA